MMPFAFTLIAALLPLTTGEPAPSLIAGQPFVEHVEKRDALKSWTILLAILAFALSLVGTFLVRSGVLTSVHAFATDPARGAFILAFLAVVVGGSLALFAWRAGAVGWAGRFDRLSRESLLLFNNVLLASVTGAVMLGTLYPLALDALGFSKISVGAPYFEAVFVPLMAPLVLLMGVAPLARWKSATPSSADCSGVRPVMKYASSVLL